MRDSTTTSGQTTKEAAAIAIRRVDKWLRDEPVGKPVTLLDTGIGTLDASIELLKAARGRGRALRIVSLVDPDARMPDIPPGLETLDLVRADPLSLVDEFGPGSFDFVISVARVASLRQVPRLTFLRILDRLTGAGLVWIERAGRDGMTRREITDLIERVGLDFVKCVKPLASPYLVMRGRKKRPGS